MGNTCLLRGVCLWSDAKASKSCGPSCRNFNDRTVKGAPSFLWKNTQRERNITSVTSFSPLFSKVHIYLPQKKYVFINGTKFQDHLKEITADRNKSGTQWFPEKLSNILDFNNQHLISCLEFFLIFSLHVEQHSNAWNWPSILQQSPSIIEESYM